MNTENGKTSAKETNENQHEQIAHEIPISGRPSTHSEVRPQQSPESILADIEDIVAGAEAQKPVSERGENKVPSGFTAIEIPGNHTIHDVKSAIKTAEKIFEKRFAENEGEAIEKLINTTEHLRQSIRD